MGGLGNQLFQIFTTLSYALKYNQLFKFPNLEFLGGNSSTIRKTYWNSFLDSLKFSLVSTIEYDPLILREQGFHYNELSPYLIHEAQLSKKTLMLYGYFQSYKYFHDSYNQIISLIDLENKKQNLTQKLGLTKQQLENTISIHFRIGDYKPLPDYHPLLPYKYYDLALNTILEKLGVSITNDINTNTNIIKKITCYYFYELQDYEDTLIIINQLLQKYPFIDFISVNTLPTKLEDWEEMLFISLINHNIIANSTFSWWGAYFNNWSNKIVTYPSLWFGPALAHYNLNDLCPPNWIKIIV